LREKNDSIVTLVKQRETYKVEKYKEDWKTDEPRVATSTRFAPDN
jgi:hypothetical protein